MRRLVERRPPELVAAGVARHPQMPHPPAPLIFFLRRGAQARMPPDLRHPGPQPVAERAAMRLVIEHRYRHKMLMPHGTIFSHAGDIRATPCGIQPAGLAATVMGWLGRERRDDCREAAIRMLPRASPSWAGLPPAGRGFCDSSCALHQQARI
jgi:hypothetical protein